MACWDIGLFWNIFFMRFSLVAYLTAGGITYPRVKKSYFANQQETKTTTKMKTIRENNIATYTRAKRNKWLCMVKN